MNSNSSLAELRIIGPRIARSRFPESVSKVRALTMIWENWIVERSVGSTATWPATSADAAGALVVDAAAVDPVVPGGGCCWSWSPRQSSEW